MFQRSASWVLPKHDPVTGGTRRFLLRHVPMARRFARAWIYWTHEARAAGFLGATWLLRTAERRARSFAKHQIHDTAIREALTPVYEIGCKRIVLSNDYLPVFNEPSVTLETGAIAHIGPDAVVMASGRHHKADVLILATGFRATEALAGIHITGQTGQSLADRWRDGAQARLGVAVPDFPNMFLLAGPNTGLGHNSLVFMLEAQIGHILRAIQRMRRHCAMRIEVRADADARFAGWLGRRMAGTVWLSGCRSWYLDRAGRNTTLWPGFSVGYWLRLRFGRSAYTMTKVPGPLPDPASTDH